MNDVTLNQAAFADVDPVEAEPMDFEQLAWNDRKQPLYVMLASTIDARKRCLDDNNEIWFAKHSETLHRLQRDFLPSGAGIDNGTQIDLNRSTSDKLVFTASYHHMDENGFYDGWTDHTITIKPSLCGSFTISISGRNRKDIKDCLAETFDIALRQLIHWNCRQERYVPEGY